MQTGTTRTPRTRAGTADCGGDARTAVGRERLVISISTRPTSCSTWWRRRAARPPSAADSTTAGGCFASYRNGIRLRETNKKIMSHDGTLSPTLKNLGKLSVGLTYLSSPVSGQLGSLGHRMQEALAARGAPRYACAFNHATDARCFFHAGRKPTATCCASDSSPGE